MRFSKKAQMKIQQMAFMLVAMMIFFSMVAIVYFVIYSSKLKDTAADLREEEAKELARQMSGTPELMFSKHAQAYSSAVDLNKALAMKGSDYERKFWNLDYLAVERVYPVPTEVECGLDNLGTCRFLIIIRNTTSLAGTQTAPVAIVWWNSSLKGGYGDYQFDIGRIHARANVPKR